MDRDELQKIAASWLEIHKRLICQWATGTGELYGKYEFAVSYSNMRDNDRAKTVKAETC